MSDRVLVRLAPELHRAIRDKAAGAEISMNSWIVHVLAAAVGSSFFHAPESGGAPRTVAESRTERWRAERELKEARSLYVDVLVRRGVPLADVRHHMDDDEALRYYREEYRPMFDDREVP